MIHRILQYPHGWQWQLLQQPKAQPSAIAASESAEANTPVSDETTLYEIKRRFPACAGWLDQCMSSSGSSFRVTENAEQDAVLSGTLMVQLSGNRSDIEPFHYWLSSKELITYHSEMRLPLRLQAISLTSKYDSCSNAPDAFALILSVLAEEIHNGLEQFSQQLAKLEAEIHSRKHVNLIEAIIKQRYILVHYSQLFIPLRELLGICKETFLTETINSEHFQRTEHRLERIDFLLQHYAAEIDTLISMDDAISSYKGNNMLRSVLTAALLLLPAAFGAIAWALLPDGMTKQEQWGGLLVIIVLVFILTVLMYGRLAKRDLNKYTQKQNNKYERLQATYSNQQQEDFKPPLNRSRRNRVITEQTSHSPDLPSSSIGSRKNKGR